MQQDTLKTPDLEKFSGNIEKWTEYVDHIYSIFENDFINNTPRFLGLPIYPKRYPEQDRKYLSFWHMTTSGNQDVEEVDREINFERCEKIRWIRWLIDNHTHPEVSYFEVKRGSDIRYIIWNETKQFAVILSKRKNKFIIITAYTVDKEHRIKSFRKDRDKYIRNKNN